MRKLLLISTAILLASCNSGVDNIPKGNKTMQSIEFEGCEYVFARRYQSISIVHKGNCPNHEQQFGIK